MVALELRYAARYPGATVVNADVYGHPGFAGGRNILCAVRGDGVLLGYAPLFPSPVDAAADPSLPHRLWAAVKPDPDLPPSAAEAVADTLMDHLRAQAATVAAALPPRRVLLTLECVTTEAPAIRHALAHGFALEARVYALARDLPAPLPSPPPPEGVTVGLPRR